MSEKREKPRRKMPPTGIRARNGKWQLLPKAGRPAAPLIVPSAPVALGQATLNLTPYWAASMTPAEIMREQAKRVADKYITRDGSHVWKHR
jgi:hypothetical protein